MKKFWYWILSLIYREYEVTVWFDGNVVIDSNGNKLTNLVSKTYNVKKIVKLSAKHIVLIDHDDNRIEVKTVTPVGYNIIEKRYQRTS